MYRIRTKYLKGSVTASQFIRKDDEVVFYHNREIVAIIPEPVEIERPLYSFYILDNGQKIAESLESVLCDNIQAINLERLFERKYCIETGHRLVKCVAHREHFADKVLTMDEINKINWV